jgi:hypothetical protein
MMLRCSSSHPLSALSLLLLAAPPLSPRTSLGLLSPLSPLASTHYYSPSTASQYLVGCSGISRFKFVGVRGRGCVLTCHSLFFSLILRETSTGKNRVSGVFFFFFPFYILFDAGQGMRNCVLLRLLVLSLSLSLGRTGLRCIVKTLKALRGLFGV